MEIYTIGFTKKTAEKFFETLKRAGIRRLVDVRLNNVSQLAGFTKKNDLDYFLKEICGAEYIHEPLLAPTAKLLNAYKKKEIDWGAYESSFIALIRERKIEDNLDKHLFAIPSVLLCSEATSEQCHRRLVADYLANKWHLAGIKHL